MRALDKYGLKDRNIFTIIRAVMGWNKLPVGYRLGETISAQISW